MYSPLSLSLCSPLSLPPSLAHISPPLPLPFSPSHSPSPSLSLPLSLSLSLSLFISLPLSHPLSPSSSLPLSLTLSLSLSLSFSLSPSLSPQMDWILNSVSIAKPGTQDALASAQGTFKDSSFGKWFNKNSEITEIYEDPKEAKALEEYITGESNDLEAIIEEADREMKREREEKKREREEKKKEKENGK